MADNIQKITRVLTQPTKNFVVKVHVKLITDKKDGRKDNFHNLFYAPDGKGYLSLDLQSFITFEIKDKDWSKDKSVLLDEKNIYQVIKAFETIIDGVYNGGIFAVNKNKKIVMFDEQRKEYTQNIYNIGTHQRMILQPAIIYDDTEGNEYEGVILFLNKTENHVELTIDAFESLYYVIKQMNLFVYSQSLVNYYMASIDKLEVTEKTSVDVKPTKYQKSITKHPLSASPDKEFVKSTMSSKQTSEEFLGIEPKK